MAKWDPPMIFLRHAQPLEERLAERLLREVGSGFLENGVRATEDDYARWLSLLRRDRFQRNLPTFGYRVPRQIAGNVQEVEVPVVFSLVAGPFEHVPGKKVRLAHVLREAERWALCSPASTVFTTGSQVDVEGLLGRLRRSLDILCPTFGFGDLRSNVSKDPDEDPHERAWPLMILGPERIQKLGKEKVLATPAFKVEPLPYGGVWIQVSENPFRADRRAVNALADHLGLARMR